MMPSQADVRGAGEALLTRNKATALYNQHLLEVNPSGDVIIAQSVASADAATRIGMLAVALPDSRGWTPERVQALHGRKVWIECGSAIDRGALVDNVAPIFATARRVNVVELKVSSLVEFVAGGGKAEGLQAFDVESPGALRQQWGLDKAASKSSPATQPTIPANAKPGAVVVRSVADIAARPVNWLWPGRIARGKVTILAGNPGLGKSQTTAAIAGIITTGGVWPGGSERAEQGDVIFLSAEDDPGDTLRPRLEAVGSDLSRVHIIDAVVDSYGSDGRQQKRSFNLQKDVVALASTLTHLRDVAAIIVDPVSAYLGGVDSHKNAEVRALLAPLSDLAAEFNVAIIGVSHLNKSAGSEALMRVTGSLAFVAAARAAFLVAADPEDRDRRLLVPMKNNVGPDSSGLAFRIEGTTITSPLGPIATSRVVWEDGAVTARADDVLRAATGSDESGGAALREAKDFLLESLQEPTPVAAITADARALGISGITLRRASQALGVVKEKAAMRGGWVWSLPPKMIKNPEDAHPKSMSTFEKNDHLRDSGGPMVEVEL